MGFSSSMTPVNCCLLIVLIRSADARSESLLDLFGLNTGRAGTGTVTMFVDEFVGAILKGVVAWENLLAGEYNILDKNNICCRISEPLPQVTLLDGLPAVPGVVGSLPGIGGCLPAKMPLVSHTSPNFFQNFLRFIPGAQDYLVSLVETPNIDTKALMGKYQWIVSTAGVHDRYCPTTEYQIIMIGPKNKISGQYEYIVLSNWAKYPTIAMARD
uniref:Lipocalin domain-containing protein n=1 Tax=Parascaris equorum TaxID=6256 RepID=A0A914RHI4_PAREQ